MRLLITKQTNSCAYIFKSISIEWLLHFSNEHFLVKASTLLFNSSACWKSHLYWEAMLTSASCSPSVAVLHGILQYSVFQQSCLYVQPFSVAACVIKPKQSARAWFWYSLACAQIPSLFATQKGSRFCTVCDNKCSAEDTSPTRCVCEECDASMIYCCRSVLFNKLEEPLKKDG